jgi:hypothetical protein
MNAPSPNRALATRLTRELLERVIYANYGAPMTRTREENINATLLGRDDGHIRCGHRLRLGLDFRDSNPVACMENLLLLAGYRDPEELRGCFVLPAETLIAHGQVTPPRLLEIDRCNPAAALQQALLLGLCTDQLFDPARPVMWTETSLTRALDLYDPRGFYA